jgi:hypothetical protein
MFVLTCRHTPLAHSSLAPHRRPAAELDALAFGRQCLATTGEDPVVTAAAAQRRPLPQLASVQHTSAQEPASQRPLRHTSGPAQLSPMLFVPTAAIPRAVAFTQ